MKTPNALFIMVLAFGLFAFTNFGKSENFHAEAQTPAQPVSTSVLPPFLEKGKIYNFAFVVNQSSNQSIGQSLNQVGTQDSYSITFPPPLTMTARIEKLDPQSGWLYVTFVSPGRNVAWRTEGSSWINFNQVFQCNEIRNLPN